MKDQIDQKQIEKIADAIKDIDKDKLTLIKLKRYGKHIYYIRDGSNPQKNKRYSLKTNDKGLATRLFMELTTKINWEGSELGGHIAASVAKLDRDTRDRTWSDALEACKYDGLQDNTIESLNSGWNQPIFDDIRNRPIIGTTRTTIQNIYKQANLHCQRIMAQIMNRARIEGWVVNPALLTAVDIGTHRREKGGTTGAITDEIHYPIMEAMEFAQDNWKPNDKKIGHLIPAREECAKTRHYQVYLWLQIMWLTGASNADARRFTVENVNWETGHISFRRGKWIKRNGGQKKRSPINWPMCEKLKEIIRPLYNKAKGDKNKVKYLLPLIAHDRPNDLLRIFRCYAAVAGVELNVMEQGDMKKVIIHSYRYRMAQLLCESGYSEREAKDMMGHKNSQVHYAYARAAKMSIKPLDQQRKEMGLDKLIPAAQAA